MAVNGNARKKANFNNNPFLSLWVG